MRTSLQIVPRRSRPRIGARRWGAACEQFMLDLAARSRFVRVSSPVAAVRWSHRGARKFRRAARARGAAHADWGAVCAPAPKCQCRLNIPKG